MADSDDKTEKIINDLNFKTNLKIYIRLLFYLDTKIQEEISLQKKFEDIEKKLKHANDEDLKERRKELDAKLEPYDCNLVYAIIESIKDEYGKLPDELEETMKEFDKKCKSDPEGEGEEGRGEESDLPPPSPPVELPPGELRPASEEDDGEEGRGEEGRGEESDLPPPSPPVELPPGSCDQRLRRTMERRGEERRGEESQIFTAITSSRAASRELRPASEEDDGEEERRGGERRGVRSSTAITSSRAASRGCDQRLRRTMERRGERGGERRGVRSSTAITSSRAASRSCDQRLRRTMERRGEERRGEERSQIFHRHHLQSSCLPGSCDQRLRRTMERRGEERRGERGVRSSTAITSSRAASRGVATSV